MKYMIMFLTALPVTFSLHAQGVKTNNLYDRYIRLEKGSEHSDRLRLELSSDVDSTWNRWDHRGYYFGFDPSNTPMYTTVNGILATPYMIQVRGNDDETFRKRWGYHVFEGYARDDRSRITMLVNKHVEMDKPVAEMYYYGNVYDHSGPAYNWFRIGSDVRNHSFMFSRDKAIFYGSLRLTNALTLGNIGRDNIRQEEPAGDHEQQAQESSQFVNFRELKESGDGTLFYDKDNRIVVIKINGQWMKLVVEPLPENIKYDF